MARQPETKVKFSIFNKEFNEGMAEMGKESTKLRKEFKLQSEQMKNSATATEMLEKRVAYLGQEKDIVRKKIEATAKQLEKAKKTYGENSNEANKLSNQLLDLRISEQKLENAISQTTTEIWQQSQEMVEASDDVKKYRKSLKELGEEADNLGNKMTVGVTAPIAAIGGIAGKSAMDLDGAIRLMNGSLGATGEEAERLKEDLQSLWYDGFADNPEEIARSIMFIKQNIRGINDGEELQKVTKHMLLLADATDSDMAEATRGVNQLMHNFGITADEALDLFKRGQEEGINYSNEMFDNVAEYAPLFKNMGFAADEYFSLLVNGAQNGAYNLDYVNDIMKEFNIRIQDGSKTTAEAFERMSKGTQKLFKRFEKGEITAQELFQAVIPELEKMKDQVEANQIGVDLFGTKFEDMGATTVYALDDINDSMKDVEGSMEDFAKIQEESFGHELRKTLRGLLEALEPIGEYLLELGRKVTPKLKELSNWFIELDDDTKKLVITLSGIAMAIGPALKVFGALSTVVGGISKGMGALTVAAGSKGVAGTLLGLISKAGPVGLAIGAFGLLAVAIGGVVIASQESIEESVKSIQAKKDELDATDALINSFEELQSKNKLSTDEMLRYMDIMDELKEAKTDEAIKKLTEEQAALLEKSGFTNEEMEEFLRLNDQLVEKAPATAKAISDQGNAYTVVLDELKELNNLERQRLLDTAYDTLNKELKEQEENLELQKDLQIELRNLEEERSENMIKMAEYSENARKLDLELADIQNQMIGASSEELGQLRQKQKELEAERRQWGNLRQEQNEKVQLIEKEIGNKQKTLEQTMKELELFDELKNDYAQMVLYQAGIVSEKGKSVQAIESEQAEIDKARLKLEQMKEAGTLVGTAYDEQNQKLIEQQQKLDEARRRLQTMNELAGRTIYKDIHFRTSPSIENINKRIGTPVNKTVYANVVTRENSVSRPIAYAEGTNFHPGGPALVGEEGPELVKQGNKLSLQSFGLLPNLKRGAQVFTAEQTRRILNGFKRLPAYAGGVGVSSDMSIPALQSNGEMQLKLTINLDGEKMAENQYSYIKEMEAIENILNNFNGGAE